MDAAELTPKLGELSQALEENTARGFQEAAYADVRKEFPAYFDALEMHPRQLVGKEVPVPGGEGMETLKDAADARDWQEATKQVLVQEINGRARRDMDENRGWLNTLQSSVELFKANTDLLPGTKGFDRELAKAVTEMATDYEVREDGKLIGYSINMQPIINQLRAQLASTRAAAAATTPPAGAPAAGAPPTPAGQAAAAAADPPQGGVASKAGSGDTPEDFSTLFGTLGLPNLKI